MKILYGEFPSLSFSKFFMVSVGIIFSPCANYVISYDYVCPYVVIGEDTNQLS